MNSVRVFYILDTLLLIVLCKGETDNIVEHVLYPQCDRNYDTVDISFFSTTLRVSRLFQNIIFTFFFQIFFPVPFFKYDCTLGGSSNVPYFANMNICNYYIE